MKRLFAAILVLALFGGLAMAADAPDLCKDAVDPYEWIGQKALFFKAAGKDNELSEKEFDADKAAGKGFVRSFEKWSTIVAFDKDGKKQIDWLEADVYRRDLRKRVLAAHDTTKDRKLSGDERTAANKALAAGKFATATPRSSGRGSRGSYWERPEMIKKYDKDKDGKLNDKEQATARDAMRAGYELRRYDTDKDGKLDKKETAARDKARAERDKVRKQLYEKFDKNKNGKIDNDERSGIGDWFRMRRYDTDGDGKLDEKETAARDKASAERDKRRAEARKRFDKDGDGKLSDKEEQTMRDYYRSRYGGRGSSRGGRSGGDR
jgi:hypothetical protein